MELSLDANVKHVVLGMAHRGRVNVMLNILGKLPEILYKEFSGTAPVAEGSGDVKYHMGYSCDIGTEKKNMHVLQEQWYSYFYLIKKYSLLLLDYKKLFTSVRNKSR